ncbi:MAG: phage tail tape measure protein, partial [Thermoleophilia bacterium]|nr:phage tail tape measure protein [Thermoleophilia bacterium]
MKVGELHAELGIKDAAFRAGLINASGGLARLGKAGIVAGAAITAALVGVAVKGLAAFAKLEKGMNEVFTLLPDITEEAMGKMTSDVQRLATQVGITTDEVMPALYQAISAGVPQENVFEFLEVASKASIGGITELETAVDGITSVVNAYGADVMSATEASDLMFTAVRLGKTDFEQLSSRLFQVIPIASALGVEFGDVTAALATMTAQGTPTRVATTQLRQVFAELSAEGTNVSDIFKEIAGQSFKDFVASGKNTQDALKLLEKHAQDTGVEVNDLFGSVEAGMGVLALTGKATDTFTDNLAEMGDAAGATDAAYEQMDQGISRSMDKIKVNVQVMTQKVGEVLAPFASDVAGWIADALPSVLDFGEALAEIANRQDLTFSAKMDIAWEEFRELNETTGDIARNLQAVGHGVMTVGHALAFLGNMFEIAWTTGGLVAASLKHEWNTLAVTLLEVYDKIASAGQKLGLVSEDQAQAISGMLDQARKDFASTGDAIDYWADRATDASGRANENFAGVGVNFAAMMSNIEAESKREIEPDWARGNAAAVEEAMGQIRTSHSATLADVLAQTNAYTPLMSGAGQNLAGSPGLAGGMNAGAGQVGTAAGNLRSQAATAGNVDLTTAGINIANSLASGIARGAPAVATAASNLADAAIAAANARIESQSPSRVFLDMGEHTIGGALATGLSRAIPSVSRAAGSLLGAIIPGPSMRVPPLAGAGLSGGSSLPGSSVTAPNVHVTVHVDPAMSWLKKFLRVEV